MTFSQEVWAIDELVRLICSHVLEYMDPDYFDEDKVHDGLILDPNSRQTLARGVLYLNRFIFRIAIKFLWMELSSINPLCALFPLDYYQRGETKRMYRREGMQDDFNRFCMYSTHVRYLGIEGRILPDGVLGDYIRLFPERPFLPRVQSITMRESSVLSRSSGKWLCFLLRSSTPAENQLSASASTLKHLHICSSASGYYGGGSLAHDLAAFQRSNVKLGGGLEVLKMVNEYICRRSYNLGYQDVIENAFVLPPPKTVDWPAGGLRHLEATHTLREFSDFFGRVAKMRALEHLKIVILDGDSARWGVEDKKKSVRHSLSSLEIEGYWWDLSPAINLCVSPSPTARLRTLRFYYDQLDRVLEEADVTQALDLPAGIVPPDHLETLTVEMVCPREYDCYPRLPVPMLPVNVLQPLLRYRQMVKLHLDLPCAIWLDIKFLHALAAVMGGTLGHLVVLRAICYQTDGLFKPVLTVDELSIITRVLFPRLETLGLDVPWRDTPSSAERDYLVASSLLRTLHVGTRRTLLGQESLKVAKFLKEHFPGLQCLYRHREGHYINDGWQPVMMANGYRGGFYGPGSEGCGGKCCSV